MFRTHAATALGVLAALLAACPDEHGAARPDLDSAAADVGQDAVLDTAPFDPEVVGGPILTIGPEGGRLVGPGVSLLVPPGALSAPTTLSVAVAEDNPLDGRNDLLTPILAFGPAGTTFAVPAHITFEVPPGRDGVLFWSDSGRVVDARGIGFAADGRAEGDVTHFSAGMVDDCEMVDACACEAGFGGGLACFHQPEPHQPCYPDTTRLFTGSNGQSKSGFVKRDVVIEQLCYCRAMVSYAYWDDPERKEAFFLCARPWRLDENNHWVCESTLDGQAPASPEDDWTTHTYVPPGMEATTEPDPDPGDPPLPADGEGPPCEGYWVDYPTLASVGVEAHAAGTMGRCDANVVIDNRWEQERCDLYGCTPTPLSDLLAVARRLDGLEADLAPEVVPVACVRGTVPR